MAVDFQTVISSPSLAYAEGLDFFRGKGMLNDALKKLAADLDRNEIDYAVIGAIALNQHGYRRFTKDIDLLLTREGLEQFHRKLDGRSVPVEVFTSGEFPGDGLPKRVVFPNPSDVSVVIDGVKTLSLEKLIELKLSSGISAPDRLKDLADVQELIKLKGLDENFANGLDEYVRAKYLELGAAVWNSASREENE